MSNRVDAAQSVEQAARDCADVTGWEPEEGTWLVAHDAFTAGAAWALEQVREAAPCVGCQRAGGQHSADGVGNHDRTLPAWLTALCARIAGKEKP